MIHILLTMCVIVNVGAGFQSLDQTYISRKSRLNSPTVHGRYVYSQGKNNPGAYETFNNDANDASGPVKYSESIESKEDLPTYQHIQSISIPKPVPEPVFPFPKPPISKYSADYEIAKAEAKYNSKFLPSKIRTDAMYERLISVMHYHPPADPNHISPYDSNNEYHIDDDDIRTSSRSLYDTWPYYYHSPYEYEHMKIGSEVEKAKEKRYAGDTATAVKPVHENFHEDDLHSPFGSLPITNYKEINTDNPIFGDQPFFSFVLNDYFDKSNEEDSLVFKGLDWGKDFDYEQPFVDIDEYSKRERRLGSNFIPNNNDGTIDSLVANGNDYNAARGESITGKGQNNNHKINKYETGDQLAENYETNYDQNKNNYKGFQDFVSAFANKFGTEGNKKDAKYILRRNHDKGENKKGFRKVYHKDEYQEEDNFFDNNNSSIKVEETGNSSAHIGGLEAHLQSHAGAALSNKTNARNNDGNSKNKKFENNHNAHSANKGLDEQLNRYRDFARKAVQSNNADYTDHYRI